MKSIIHTKLVGRLRSKAYSLDFITDEALVFYKDFLFVCHHQRFTSSEAWVLLQELEGLGLAKRLNKHNIKVLL